MQIVAFADFYTVRSLLLVDKSWCEAVEEVYNRKITASTSSAVGGVLGADVTMTRVCPPERLRKLLAGYHPDARKFLHRGAISANDVVLDYVAGLDDEVLRDKAKRFPCLVRRVRRDRVEAAASALLASIPSQLVRPADGGAVELDEGSSLALAGFEFREFLSQLRIAAGFPGEPEELVTVLPGMEFCAPNLDRAEANGVFAPLEFRMQLLFDGQQSFVQANDPAHLDTTMFITRREAEAADDLDEEEPDAIDFGGRTGSDGVDFLIVKGRVLRGEFPLFWMIIGYANGGYEEIAGAEIISLEGLPREAPKKASSTDRAAKKYVWVLA